MNIGIGGTDYIIPVQIVDNLQVDFILGTPFLNTYGVILDFKTRMVHIDGNSIVAQNVFSVASYQGSTTYKGLVRNHLQVSLVTVQAQFFKSGRVAPCAIMSWEAS